MKRFLTTTFSPMMIADHCEFEGVKDAESWAKNTAVRFYEQPKDEQEAQVECVLAVGHEPTAKFLTKRWGVTVPFSRMDIVATAGDMIVAFIPKFRVEESREYTMEEIERAQFKCYVIEVREKNT